MDLLLNLVVVFEAHRILLKVWLRFGLQRLQSSWWLST